MVKSNDSECISFLHPLLWMLPCPPWWGMTEILWSLLSAILSFCSAVIWTASHVGGGMLRFDSRMWFVLIDDAWESEGIVAVLSWPQWGRVNGTGYPNLTPAPVLLGVLISLCVVAWSLRTSPLHDLQCIARGISGACGWAHTQLPFWLRARSMISLNLQDFPGLWLWPWRHRSLGSSLHRTFCSAPAPYCTTCYPESQLVSVLSSVQEGSQVSCQVVEDPWVAGKAIAKLWLHRTSCGLVNSVMTILQVGLTRMVEGLCPSSFLTSLYPCATLSFLGRNDWNPYLQAFSSSRHLLPNTLYLTLWFSPQSSPNFSSQWLRTGRVIPEGSGKCV